MVKWNSLVAATNPLMKTTLTIAILSTVFLAGSAFSESKGSGHGIEFLPANISAPSKRVTTDKDLQAMRDSEQFGGKRTSGFRSDYFSVERLSTFLVMGGKTTILPKQSVLHIPRNIDATISPSIIGKAILPQELINTQRASVQIFNVTLPEITGKKEISPEKLETIFNSKFVVIAYLQGNPISAPALQTALENFAKEQQQPKQ